ncbi:MAG: hypothetical protein KBS81_11935 [Spirochaetales bacterium]|nr:hypothetical protein [Candidatus Physcosoma equi]
MQKFSNMIRKVYRILLNGVALDPEIAAYNKLMNLDGKAGNAEVSSTVGADTVVFSDAKQEKEKASIFGWEVDRRAKELGIDREVESKKTVREFVGKHKNEIIKDLLKTKKVLVDGVLMPTDIAKGDLPYEKEFMLTKILQDLGIPALLLPRFANSFLAKTYGVKIDKKGSFDEAVAYLPNQRAFIEYKNLEADSRLNVRLGEAVKKGAEYIFVTGNSISLSDAQNEFSSVLNQYGREYGPNVLIYSLGTGELHSNFYEQIKNDDYNESSLHSPRMWSTPNFESRAWHFRLTTTNVNGY